MRNYVTTNGPMPQISCPMLIYVHYSVPTDGLESDHMSSMAKRLRTMVWTAWVCLFQNNKLKKRVFNKKNVDVGNPRVSCTARLSQQELLGISADVRSVIFFNINCGGLSLVAGRFVQRSGSNVCLSCCIHKLLYTAMCLGRDRQSKRVLVETCMPLLN